MEVSLPFPAKTVKTVFQALEQYDSIGLFPTVSLDALETVLELSLFLGFDPFLRFLAPMVAQNLQNININVIKQFPLFLQEAVVNSIPVCTLDPDFVIAHFGKDLLQQRIERSPAPKLNDIPFGIATQVPDNDPDHALANALLYYSNRFMSSQFVRENATQIITKRVVDLTGFTKIREILMFKGNLDGVFVGQMLVPTIEKVEIMKTKLEKWQFTEIFELVRRGQLTTLTLRDVKMKYEQCKELLSAIRATEKQALTFLDISANSLGSTIIKEVLEVASKAGIQKISVDDNFLEPDAAALKPICTASHSAISLRGLHWDEESAEVVATALKNDVVKLWDLSAQTVHKHGDPDMSPEMALFVLSGCSTNIESLFLSNHKLVHADLSCLVHVELRALTLSNSSLQEDSLPHITPLLDRLVLLDLSDNSIVLRNTDFVAQVAASHSLEYLFLSDNTLGDAAGRVLFDQMLENGSNIKTLRLRNCFLKRQSSHALMRLLGSGHANFDELDIGVNEMFHVPYNYEGPFRMSRVQCLFLGANNCHELGLWQALNVISGMKFIDLDRTRWNCVAFAAPLLRGVVGLSMCFMKIPSDTEIIRVLRHSQARDLWIVNSCSRKTICDLLHRYKEIPLCLTIHVGQDMSDLCESSPIPLVTESI